MTAAALAMPPVTILRTASGEPPLGADGEAFRADQGEMLLHHNPAYQTPGTRIGLLELNNGKWLSFPFGVGRPQFDSRDEALRSGIAAMIRKARRYMRNGEGQGTHWTEGYAGRVIEWALSLKPETGKPASEEITPPANVANDLGAKQASEEITESGGGVEGHANGQSLRTPGSSVVKSTSAAAGVEPGPSDPADWANTLTDKMAAEELTIAGYAASDAGAGLSDPVVRYLVEQHALRKQFPAKHIFSMTTEVADGRIVSIATCSCKQVIRFGSNDHLRMNAAIEAHWRRFSHEKTVDGRGQPINAEERTAASTKPTRRAKQRSAPKAGDNPELANAALPEPVSSHVPGVSDAGSTSIEHGAGGLSAPPASAPLPGPGDGADALNQAAPIGAPATEHDALLAISGSRGLRLASAAMVVRQYVEKGLAIYLDGAKTDWTLTETGWKRLYKLDADRVAEETRTKRKAAGEAAPIGAGSDEFLGDGNTVGRTGDAVADAVNGTAAPGPVVTDQHAVANTPGAASISDDDDLAIEWPSYDTFLDDKIVTAPMRGIEVARDSLHPWLKPHCKDLTVWALRLGCAAIFANFGLHKTAMQLEWVRQLAKHTGQPTLCVVPLGVRHGFVKEALQLGMDVRFIRTTAELDDLYVEGVRHFLTNYESVRDGKLDPNQFGAVSLDEASVLRSYGSKTYQEFLPLFDKVPFKLVATATPSPNRYKELIHYAGFLGVMDTGLALTRWFQRNSEKAGDLTLYPHKEDEFWMWVHSWAAFLQRPSELGYSDEGYELPPLKLRWHEVPADHSKAEPERDGQGVMFRAVANSLSEAAKSRRDSLTPRIAKMSEIIAADPDSHRILWHDLEAEREAIEAALPEVVTIKGSMDIDAREVRLHDFEEGRTKYFGTKPVLSGSGSNFQYHCHKAIYVALPGYGYKFNDFLQSLYRLQRFGQEHLVEVDIIYSEDERAGRAALEEKWARDIEMRARMSEIILKYGLDTLPLRDRLARSIGVKRVEIKGEKFRAINNDAVAECRTWEENSVDEIITSIPFSNHYEYSASYNDFGHTDDNGHFWGQMDFLTAELLRMLKPGRLACIHVKDRILFGSVTGEGVPTISPFHAEAIMHYRAHGFQYMGMITIVTDVVRENNQTYRLGWSENCKDGTKMGVGSPEYVLLLRKPQSDKSKGYADIPVVKTKMESGLDLTGEGQGYSRARWQIDAHAFWRSSGNRMLTPEEFAACSSSDLAKLFAKTTVDRVYDYEAHVKIGEAQERTGTLPATFMAIAPGSHDPDVWHDINRMRTLNMLQQRKGAEMHLCPLQFDIVDRLIERYSNEGDLVFDPFGGLMTVPYRALLKNRRGAATELNANYFLDGVHYLRMAEEKMTTPALFDLAAFDQAVTPPTDMTEAEA